MAGAIAKQFLSEIEINAYTSAVGNIKLEKSYDELDLSAIDSNAVRCPDQDTADQVMSYVSKSRN